MSAEKMIARFDALDRALVEAGFPPSSPWWRAVVSAFYASGKRRLVLRVGRRGGKSSTLSRLAVVEALFGDHAIPPGDVGIVGIVSVSRDEASQRLRTVKAILDALGEKYHPIDGGIELDDRPIVFKVFAASISGVVGGTWIFALLDEVAHWKDNDTGANPATQIFAKLLPTVATQPHAKIIVSSAPFGKLDLHYDMFERGDTTSQMTAWAASYVANPTLTEEACRELTGDEPTFDNEFRAIPRGNINIAWNEADTEAAFIQRPLTAIGRPVLALDPSSGRKDAWTFCIVQWCTEIIDERSLYLWADGVDSRGRIAPGARRLCDEYGSPLINPDWRPSSEPILSFTRIAGIEGTFSATISAETIVTNLARQARAFGCSTVISDQRESFLLASAFARHGMQFRSYDWTLNSKADAVAHITRLLRERRIQFEEHAKLRSELQSFVSKVTPSGKVTFQARGSAHDDHVALVVTASLHDLEGGFQGSPTQQPHGPPTTSGMGDYEGTI